MTVDYTAWSMGIHGSVFATALGGSLILAYSRIGADHLKELSKLRGGLLKSIRESLSGHLRPLLKRSIETKLVLPSGEHQPRSQLSEEDLQDTLRDFLKSESQGMLDLRIMQATYDCLVRAIANLRIFVVATIILSGILLTIAALIKADAFDVSVAWPHFVALGMVVASISITLCWYFRILYLSGRAERLVSKYADFS